MRIAWFHARIIGERGPILGPSSGGAAAIGAGNGASAVPILKFRTSFHLRLHFLTRQAHSRDGSGMTPCIGRNPGLRPNVHCGGAEPKGLPTSLHRATANALRRCLPISPPMPRSTEARLAQEAAPRPAPRPFDSPQLVRPLHHRRAAGDHLRGRPAGSSAADLAPAKRKGPIPKDRPPTSSISSHRSGQKY
jgi:hypothetical protein